MTAVPTRVSGQRPMSRRSATADRHSNMTVLSVSGKTGFKRQPRSRAQLTTLTSAPDRQPAHRQAIHRQKISDRQTFQTESSFKSVSKTSPAFPLPTSRFTHRSVPVWLRLLLFAQRGSAVMTFLLVTVTLVIYGWTVYSQQLWGREYRKLEGLQHQERQTTAANEVLKNQIAREAESPTSGLVMPDPSHTIFLQPAQQRPAVVTSTGLPITPLAPAKPLGY
jgi:hypothetical protein